MKTSILIFIIGLLGCANAFTTGPAAWGAKKLSSVALRESKDDLKELSKLLNPVIGHFDPLGVADANYWGFTDEQNIGWLRHAEIKHGRVAMMAFIGYCAQSVFTFPWAMTLSGDPFPSVNLSPPEQWDALPLMAKTQILLFIGFLEWYSELSLDEATGTGQVHYTRGGKPGKYPTFDGLPHWVPFNLFDPFGLSKNTPKAYKERRLRVEINNGRLAQIGIISLLCEQKIPGSVPSLAGIVNPYQGEVMAPFEFDFTLF